MPKLELGQLLCTASVSELMSDNTDFSEHISKALNRYLNGDWGDLCDEDKLQNDEAMKNGNDRILASYEHSDHDDWKIWIITEWDRSATTILFPHEY